jgi:hypothetical protein
VTLGNRPVYVEGDIDCGDWLAARRDKRAVAFEHFVLGFLNGISVGTDTEFWHADGRRLSRDSVYFWIDNYCRTHSVNPLITAVTTLFKERSGVQ